MASTAIQTPRFTIPAAATLLGRLATFHRRRVTRRQLANLTLERLRDVGLDPDLISRGHDVPGDPWLMSRLMSLR